MKPTIKPVLLALTLMLLSSQCSGLQSPVSPENDTVDTQINNPAMTINDFPLEELSKKEIEGLIFMREEEKLARDVYALLYSEWGQRIFLNISKSEDTHTTAVKSILDRYDIPDPVGEDTPGEFTDSTLSQLYHTLVEAGRQSLIDGLKVGAAIEEIDILDLRHQLDEVVDNEDIIFVYENLLKGSENHLRAFVRNLERQGVDYQPQHLSKTDYQAIITSAAGNGRPW